MMKSKFSVMKLRSAIMARVEGRNAEGGVALLSAVFFMVLVAGLSVVLLSAILGQATPAYTAQKNTRTVYAAQSGLQTTLALIRSATAAPDASGKIFGDIHKLPCAVSGRVNAGSDGTNYTVQVLYFVDDPTNKTPAWRTSNALACSNSAGLSTDPKFAYLKAGGLGVGVPGNADSTYGDRYLSAVYKFRINNVNIAGGMIFNNDQNYCTEATSATDGATIKFVPKAQCVSSPLQLWSNGPDYQIKLASTATNGAAGLCITGPVAAGQATQNALLRPCKATNDAARWNQLWSWTGDYSWRGSTNPINSSKSNYCMSPGASNGTNLTGLLLKVADGCNGTLAPDSQVGAGAASYSTHQLVNYKEFGRCADVTNENIGSTFMISYPCKQDPSGTGAGITWNHKWFYSEPPAGQTQLAGQQIYINLYDDSTKKYCFQTPATGSGSSYPAFAACNNGAQQNWKRVYDSGDYNSSYLVVDTYGRCLATDATDLFSGYISKLKMQTCDGSLAQKWNAPPTYVDSEFGGYREVSS